MIHLTTFYWLAIVFASVLAEQAGLPIPAVPTLIAAGALAADRTSLALSILPVAISAAVIGDSLWFLAGRKYGHRLLKLLSRISFVTDSRAQQTQTYFARSGTAAVVVAKFIPGFSTIAPALAGSARMKWSRFLFLDGLGAAVWSGLWVGTGLVLRAEFQSVIGRLRALEAIGLYVLAALLVACIGYMWLQGRRFQQHLKSARITVAELQTMIVAHTDPLIVDLRSTVSRYHDPRTIPHALSIDIDALEELKRLPKDREIVFFCTYTSEATIARMARKLTALGFKHVRPLFGGLDAWVAASYDVEFVQGVLA